MSHRDQRVPPPAWCLAGGSRYSGDPSLLTSPSSTLTRPPCLNVTLGLSLPVHPVDLFPQVMSIPTPSRCPICGMWREEVRPQDSPQALMTLSSRQSCSVVRGTRPHIVSSYCDKTTRKHLLKSVLVSTTSLLLISNIISLFRSLVSGLVVSSSY